MRKFLRWLMLAAFSAGLCVEITQRWRTTLGVMGFLLSFLGVLYNLCGAPPAPRDVSPVDLHECVVVETFPRLTPLEAAALVGVLHEHRLASRRQDPGSWEALELESAVSLVARTSGLPADRIRQLYRSRWIELRGTTAPRIIASLRRHRLVDRLLPFEEGE